MDWELSNSGPEVECIAFGLALGVQTAEEIAFEIDGEMARLGGSTRFVMNGTGTAALGSGTGQMIKVAEMVEDLIDGDTTAQVGKIDKSDGIGNRSGGGGRRSDFRIVEVGDRR